MNTRPRSELQSRVVYQPKFLIYYLAHSERSALISTRPGDNLGQRTAEASTLWYRCIRGMSQRVPELLRLTSHNSDTTTTPAQDQIIIAGRFSAVTH